MIKNIFVFTMTAGLGDALIMGDLMHKIEKIVPNSRCLMIHRASPHIKIWTGDQDLNRFYNIFELLQMTSLTQQLRNYRRSGAVVFAHQMAPGSYQGFFLYSLLKRLKAIDYIVDFNLINADIVIPVEGNYILDIHLNQIKRLLKIDSFPLEVFKLELPFSTDNVEKNNDVIGIHPWSRRGGPCFTWEWSKWLSVITFILQHNKKLVIFGKDKQFFSFQDWVTKQLTAELTSNLSFVPSESVEHMVKQIAAFSGILSVNTATVHIGYGLNKKMVILNGPSLDLWVPKGNDIVSIYDTQAKFPGNDSLANHHDFPQVSRIDVNDVIAGIKKIFI